MRKLIFSAFMVTSAVTVFAQNLEDVNEKISKGKYDEAKEKIDKYLTSSKGLKDPNGWYTKGIVYYNLGLDSSKTDRDYKQESFEAFAKYYEMDAKNVMGTLEQNARLFQLYDSYYNAGVKAFNEKKFDVSFKNFSKAFGVEEFINARKFTYNGQGLPALDTSLILNVAAAASQANMQDSAISYYKRLADAKLADERYMEVYQMLVDHYTKKSDEANKQKYLAIGKELYPKNDYWYEAELTPVRDDKAKLFAKYDELATKNPSSYYLTYNYAVELFNYLHAGEKKPADAATWAPKVEGAISAAIKANPTPDANLLMARYLSDQIFQLEDSTRLIKGTKPEDVKRKQALVAQTNALWDKAAPYAEAAFEGYAAKGAEMKPYEKGNLRFVSNILVDYYNMKKQADKAKTIQDKAKQIGV